MQDSNYAHNPTVTSSPAECPASDSSSTEEIQKLKERVQQRDDEISISSYHIMISVLNEIVYLAHKYQ